MKILTALPLAPAAPPPEHFLSHRSERTANGTITTHLSLPPLRRLSLRTRVFGAETAAAPAQPLLRVDEEETQLREGFIEIGYVCNVHGLRGELKVFPSTDFPQLRFCQPGRRWIRSRVMGKQVIQEVELLGGRSHPGHKIWIVTIAGIDTVDKAKQMVGSTILVKEEDRPTLEDGDFYTPDLVGMRVVLKENDTTVGTVVSIITCGASDLLQVMPGSSQESPSISTNEVETPGSLILIPFVEAIVPDVDMTKRVIQITPPKGLLELNLRSDSKSKKERSQLKWRQKKKLQQRVIAAKKKLIAMGQKHALQGFSFGEKDAKGLLANQIADINYKLFQHAIRSIDIPCDRNGLSEFLTMDSIQGNSLRISHDSLSTTARNDDGINNSLMLKNGIDLLCENKVGIILVMGGNNSPTEKSIDLLQNFLLDDEMFRKIDGEQVSLPLVVVSPANEVQLYQKHFSDHSYFGFDKEKVRFLEEAKLPVLNKSFDEKQNTHRILLTSPWEILESPVGSGGVIDLLSTQNILDDFSKWGIEYVEICSLSGRTSIGQIMLLGLTSCRGMNLGIKNLENSSKEEEFDIIMSMKYLTEITKQAEKAELMSMTEIASEHVELIDNKWVNIHPNLPNSIHFRSSIYKFLGASDADRMCVLHITDSCSV